MRIERKEVLDKLTIIQCWIARLLGLLGGYPHSPGPVTRFKGLEVPDTANDVFF